MKKKELLNQIKPFDIVKLTNLQVNVSSLIDIAENERIIINATRIIMMRKMRKHVHDSIGQR